MRARKPRSNAALTENRNRAAEHFRLEQGRVLGGMIRFQFSEIRPILRVVGGDSRFAAPFDCGDERFAARDLGLLRHVAPPSLPHPGGRHPGATA
jgi:hypothetical protein